MDLRARNSLSEFSLVEPAILLTAPSNSPRETRFPRRATSPPSAKCRTRRGRLLMRARNHRRPRSTVPFCCITMSTWTTPAQRSSFVSDTETNGFTSSARDANHPVYWTPCWRIRSDARLPRNHPLENGNAPLSCLSNDPERSGHLQTSG